MSRTVSRRFRHVAVLLVALLAITSMVAIGAASGGLAIDDSGSAVSAERVSGTAGVQPAVSGSNASANGPDDVALTTGDDRHELTLVTGHTVTVIERGDDRRYLVEDANGSDAPFRAVERPDGTYVLPADVDTSIYSEALFNVDLLIEQGYTDDRVPGTPVIVSLEDRPDIGAASLEGFQPTETLESIDAVAGIASAGTGAGIATEEGSPVEAVHLDTTVEVQLDDSADAIDAGAARSNFDVTGEGVRVAVLDTGIDADHPDFGDRVVHRADFSGDGLGDRQGHGTHVAGIVAGDGTDGDGEYVGIAPEASLLDVKVLGDDGSGTLSDIAAGIEHAVAQDADVISMSIGGPVQSNDPLVDAVEYAVDEGVTVVVAAGNDGPGYRTISTPGVADGAITVGASNATFDGVAGFSSSGPTPLEQRVKPEVVAPGWGITAAGSEGAGEAPYTTKSGTSMATPHVSGLAALLHEAEDGDGTGPSPGEIEDRLATTADPVGSADSPDIFRQGAGQVNATAALGSDVLVHDAVRGFGVVDEAGVETTVIPVENTGDEPVDLTVDATVTNLDEDRPLEGVTLNRTTMTVEPGAIEHVELAINTTEAYGLNAGVVTFAGDDATYRSAVGFVRGLEVTVEKEFNEKNTNHWLEGLYAWSNDGTFQEFTFDAFYGGSDYSFVIPDAEMDLTFWSLAEYEDIEDPDAFSEPAYTVREGVTVNRSNSHIVLDETETVTRDLDTSAVADGGPFDVLDYQANIHARLPDGSDHSFFFGGLGEQAHYTPIDADDLTNVSTNYVMVPADAGGDGGEFDVPTVYTLVGATTAIDADDPSFVVDPETFAEENVSLHRTRGESYSASTFLFAADRHSFPGLLPITTPGDIGADREEMTWVRNAEGEFEMVFHADPTTSFRYVGTSWSPDVGETKRTPVNVGPFVPNTDWSIEDGSMNIDLAWAADQGDTRLAAYKGSGTPNEVSVSLDGETVLDGTSRSGEVTVSGPVGDGTEVAIELVGNSLAETRDVETRARYVATTDPETANAPPNVGSVEIVDAGPNEPIDERKTTLEVEVSSEADLRQFRAFYANGASDLPGEDTAWRAAGAKPVGDDTYRFHVKAKPAFESLDLGFTAVDHDGNEMTVASLGALPVDYDTGETAD